MSTDNTKINVNMILMSVSNLLVQTGIYMLYPIMPAWLVSRCGCESWLSGILTGLFGLGILLMGPFYGYLVDKYRRKTVCWLSFIGVALAVLLSFNTNSMAVVIVSRLAQGAFFGLSQMALGSCLVIDLSDSSRRTEANATFAWYGRLGLALGPFIGILLSSQFDTIVNVYVSVAFLIIGAAMVQCIYVPFRAPLNPPICSFDRFWMPKGFPLVINILPITILLGIIFSRYYSMNQVLLFGYMLVGFATTIMIGHQNNSVHRRIDMLLIGMIWILAVILCFNIFDVEKLPVLAIDIVLPMSGFVVGCAFGISLSFFLLKFIDIADHCQRGTANNTFKVCCELGISIGFGLCYLLMYFDGTSSLGAIEIGLASFAILFYLLYTRKWIKKAAR